MVVARRFEAANVWDRRVGARLLLALALLSGRTRDGLERGGYASV